MKSSFLSSVGLALFLIGITLGNSGNKQDNSSLVDDAGGRKPEDFPGKPPKSSWFCNVRV